MTADDIIRTFHAVYGGRPEFIVRAPGRVDVIGAHTDYNDGWVLPAAISRYAWLAVASQDEPVVTIAAQDMGGESVSFSLDNLSDRKTLGGSILPAWAQYAAGVAWSFQEAGLPVRGCRAILASNVPVGAGLSSSAAVEVAYGLAWLTLASQPVDRMRLAQLCQKAENKYVGVNSGLMDQFASSHGKENHALLFDCRTLDWEAVPLPGDVALVIADTGTRRTLATSHYNERRADCEEAVRVLKTVLPETRALRDVSSEQFEIHRNLIPERARLRAAHIIGENARVLGAAQALRERDAERLGNLMDESHISGRDLFEASGPALDAMWKAAHGHPARLGGRFAGAGWAGCMVFLARRDDCQEFIDYLAQTYQRDTGLTPTLYQMQAADGAQVVA